jgi:SAM-dependent methyltransferase
VTSTIRGGERVRSPDGSADQVVRDYREINREAWDVLSRGGCESSLPFGHKQFRRARQYLDHDGWLPWDRLRRVLCLAGGGGQQGPLFAWLGYDVTVADLSAEQLQRDREAAVRHGLEIECVQADMLNLSVLWNRDFDLVYQPVSTCYVPDLSRLYREVHQVLRPGGLYLADHWNPIHMQLADSVDWRGGYRISRPLAAVFPATWPDPDATSGRASASCLHYIHSHGNLLGHLCDAGFSVRRYTERPTGDAGAAPGTPGHLAAYVPTWIRFLARRLPGPGRARGNRRRR